jgi:hypothetical protein
VIKNFVGLLRGDGVNSSQKAEKQGRGREGPGNKAKSDLVQHERSPDTAQKEYHLTVAAQ